VKDKALFLDRDGVINIDHGYVHKVEDFDFVEGIFDLTREAVTKGYLIFIITNQSGIGRGFYSINDFNLLTNWMYKRFVSEGVVLSEVYYSPYHPTHGKGKFKQDHMSRKPKTGMIDQAVKKFHINLSVSILIGDKMTDIQAGQSAGIGTNILYLGSDTMKPLSKLPYCSVATLYDAKLYL
jgi:D-glycero-D-manno-heptose 1,7-bisphosphate phosphatase